MQLVELAKISDYLCRDCRVCADEIYADAGWDPLGVSAFDYVRHSRENHTARLKALRDLTAMALTLLPDLHL